MMRNIISHNGDGARNSWVCGHERKGPESEEMVMERYRKEVEKCDRLLATLILVSCAGGSDSGVGTYIMGSY
jgi:hypothetical protein